MNGDTLNVLTTVVLMCGVTDTVVALVCSMHLIASIPATSSPREGIEGYFSGVIRDRKMMRSWWSVVVALLVPCASTSLGKRGDSMLASPRRRK